MSVYNFNKQSTDSLEYDQFQTKIIQENNQLNEELQNLKNKVNFQKGEIDYLNKKLDESKKLNYELKRLIYRKNGIAKIKKKKIKFSYFFAKIFNFKEETLHI